MEPTYVDRYRLSAKTLLEKMDGAIAKLGRPDAIEMFELHLDA
ncbi:MAG: hypothetical protein U0744_17955 [Gemmataceae bacterium]